MSKKLKILLVFCLFLFVSPTVLATETSDSLTVEWNEKTKEINIVHLPVQVVGLELTLLLEDVITEPLEYTPFLSTDYALLQQNTPLTVTIYVTSQQNMNDGESFYFGKLDLKGGEILEVVNLKTVDFLLQEQTFDEVLVDIISVNEDESEDTEENLEEEESEEEKEEELEEESEEAEKEELTQEQRYQQLLLQYSDIQGHWAEERMLFVLDRGYFSGVTDSTFSPDSTMTRGMFVTVLGNVAEIDKKLVYHSTFSDVSYGDWYYSYVGWAVAQGIASGVGDGSFLPNQSISREQLAVMLLQYINTLPVKMHEVTIPKTFSDHSSISSWALEAVYSMQALGLISGKDGNNFDPQGQATRAEVATVLKNFMESLEQPSTSVG